MERNRIEFDDTIFLNQFQNEKSSTITREYNYHNPLRIVKSLLPNVLVRKYRENPTLQVEPEIVKSQAAGKELFEYAPMCDEISVFLLYLKFCTFVYLIHPNPITKRQW